MTHQFPIKIVLGKWLASDIDQLHWMFLPQKCNMGVSPLHARDFCPLFGSKLLFTLPLPYFTLPWHTPYFSAALFQGTSLSVRFQWIPQSACVLPIWFTKLVRAKKCPLHSFPAHAFLWIVWFWLLQILDFNHYCASGLWKVPTQWSYFHQRGAKGLEQAITIIALLINENWVNRCKIY